jgi:hypothetical protein
MKHHWDWDLSDPEVRAAWQRGEIDRFYAPELGWPHDIRPRACFKSHSHSLIAAMFTVAW